MALLLTLGLLGAGSAIGWGFLRGRQVPRFVTVKGLAEREVLADQGTWKITFSSYGEALDQAIAQNLRDRGLVLGYLKAAGVGEQEIRLGMPRVEDHSDFKGERVRFSIQDSVLLVSSQVNLIQKVAATASELLAQGVALSGWENPQYFFTDLSAIKPQMIAEATQDARKGAEQFAKDSRSKLGPILRGSQGLFSFLGESSGIGETEQIRKIARVVITVDYLLVD